MNRDIEILKNGRMETTLSLGSGTYRLGRSASADIVLSDSAVSKIHAVLTIDNDTFTIKDNGSANGLYHQGKKISEKSFDGHFEIDIRPFVIRTAAAPRADSRKPARSVIDTLRGFSINNIKISLFLLFSVTLILTLIIGYVPLKNQTAAVQRREILKTGVLLTRYLAEMNRPFMEAGQSDRVRTSPIRLEDGVIYAFVVDGHGKIIAPQEKQGDFIDWPGLQNAFAQGTLKIDDGPQKEKIIFYPILDQNQTLGAAIIGFAFDQTAGSTSAGLGGTVFVLTAILFAVSLALAYLLARAFLNPLRSLNDAVEIAIKKGGAALDFQAPYTELEDLRRSFDRLLMRGASPLGPSPSPQAPETISPASDTGRPPVQTKKTVPQTTAPFPLSMEKRLAELTAPWCIIDREDYTVKRLSGNFAGVFGTPECREGMHIIEALETDIIAPVSQMIDSENADNLTVTHGDSTSVLRRLTDPADKSAVILVFEDKTA